MCLLPMMYAAGVAADDVDGADYDDDNEDVCNGGDDGDNSDNGGRACHRRLIDIGLRRIDATNRATGGRHA